MVTSDEIIELMGSSFPHPNRLLRPPLSSIKFSDIASNEKTTPKPSIKLTEGQFPTFYLLIRRGDNCFEDEFLWEGNTGDSKLVKHGNHLPPLAPPATRHISHT